MLLINSAGMECRRARIYSVNLPRHLEKMRPALPLSLGWPSAALPPLSILRAAPLSLQPAAARPSPFFSKVLYATLCYGGAGKGDGGSDNARNGRVIGRDGTAQPCGPVIVSLRAAEGRLALYARPVGSVLSCGDKFWWLPATHSGFGVGLV